MSFEIELKTEHDSPYLKPIIDKIVGQEGSPVEKKDIYYKKPNTEIAAFRIREENDDILITAKQNKRVDGIETNVECEFKVDPIYFEQTQEFASLLGYEILLYKHKTGWQWTFGNIHVELLFVETLSWFLELEIIAPNLDKKEEAVEELYNFLEICNVDKSLISKKSYQQMLSEKQLELKEKGCSSN